MHRTTIPMYKIVPMMFLDSARLQVFPKDLHGTWARWFQRWLECCEAPKNMDEPNRYMGYWEGRWRRMILNGNCLIVANVVEYETDREYERDSTGLWQVEQRY